MTNMNDPQSQASVDVGGTKIAAGVVDSAGKTFSKLKLRTAKESRQKTFEQIAETLAAKQVRLELLNLKKRLPYSEGHGSPFCYLPASVAGNA